MMQTMYAPSIFNPVTQWQAVDSAVIGGTAYHLIENGHGATMIVDGDNNVVMEDAWNGLDDLRYHLGM